MVINEDDLNERRYLVLSPSSAIPWDDINQEEGDELAQSVDGQYILVELNAPVAGAWNQEDIRIFKEQDIENWTEPLP